MSTSAGARLAPIAVSLFITGGVALIGAGAAMATDTTATTPTTPAADTTAAPVAPPTGGALGEGVCVQENLEWSGTTLLASFSPEFDTGLVVPTPEPGGSVEILGASWVARNVYPDQDPSHTRAIDDQANERFALFVGDAQVGQLTPDLPDTVAEGAVSDWASGDQLGSFGPATVGGGRVVLKHASLFGFTESANSLEPQLISIDLRRCGPPAATTTTAAPTTIETTTTVEVIPPSTDPIATTQPIVETTTTSTIPATTTPRTSTTQPILVATGRTSGWIVGAGGASLLSGLALMRLRRRPLAR